MNYRVQYSLNITTEQKSFEVIVLALIYKKTNKELIASIGKIGIKFHLSHSHVFWLAY